MTASLQVTGRCERAKESLQRSVFEREEVEIPREEGEVSLQRQEGKVSFQR